MRQILIVVDAAEYGAWWR